MIRYARLRNDSRISIISLAIYLIQRCKRAGRMGIVCNMNPVKFEKIRPRGMRAYIGAKSGFSILGRKRQVH